MKKLNTNKKGFTIIEVVLVLAIAGLIFMMVFIALPSLQRSQRDTQRSNDIARVQTALNQYQANNRGAIPTTGTYVKGHETKATTGTKIDTKSWSYFYDNYLIVAAGGSQDVFADPDGEPYALWIQPCSSKGTPKVGDDCDAPTQRYDATFDNQANGFADGIRDEATAAGKDTVNKGNGNHSVSIVTHATCENEVAKYSSGSRKVAILYKKEGGGTFCLNN